MDKVFLRSWVLSKKKGIYNVILSQPEYAKMMAQLPTEMFIDWLEKELDLEKGILKYQSLATAWRRVQKQGQKKRPVETAEKPKLGKDDVPDFRDLNFK